MTRRWNSRLLAVAVFGLCLGQLQSEEWQKLPPMPEPNGGFIAGVSDGKIYVIGGTNWEGGVKRWLTAVHSFDPEAGKWNRMQPFPSSVAYAVVARVNKDGKGFGFAGGTRGEAPFVLQAGVSGAGKIALSPGLPVAGAKVLAGGGWLGEKLVLCGGTDDPANIAGFTRTTVALEWMGNLEKLPDYPGKPFGIAASAVAGDSLFVFGGANWTGKEQEVSNTDEACAFSMSSNTWRKLEPFPYPARGITAVTVRDGVIYIAGGYKNDREGFTDQAFFYHINGNRYTAAPPLPHKAMVGLVACDGFLYCLGGEDKQKSRTDACFRIPISELLR